MPSNRLAANRPVAGHRSGNGGHVLPLLMKALEMQALHHPAKRKQTVRQSHVPLPPRQKNPSRKLPRPHRKPDRSGTLR